MQSTINFNWNAGGVAGSGRMDMPGTLGIALEKPLAAGKAGTLEAGSGNTSRVITLGADHGVEETDFVSVFWDGGVRHHCTLTHDSTTITVSDGEGANLPAAETAVVVGIQQELLGDASFDGDNLSSLLCACSRRCNLDFRAAGDSPIGYVNFPANGLAYWQIDTGSGVSPLSGSPVTAIYGSLGDAEAGDVQIVGMLT
jgi:hypothetical protein